MTDGLRRWMQWLDLPRRPRLLAALAGLLLGIAQPPFGIIPGLLGYAILLWALDRDLGRNPKRTAFFMGWLAGLGYFLIGCFWVAEAFLVDADTYGWMAIPAALALSGGIALFWGGFAVLYRLFAPSNMWRFVWFAALFSVLEMTRGMIFSGFPWNPAGATWLAGSAMSQVAAYVGVYGLGFLTVLTFSAPAVVRLRSGLQGFAPVIWAVLTLAGLYGLGQHRLATTHVGTTNYVVRIVQPNIGQKAKWSRDGFRAVFNDYVAMTKAPPTAGKPWPNLVVWPEGALPASAEELMADDSWTAPVMLNLLRDKQSLIFGAYRGDQDPRLGQVWRNSMIFTRQDGEYYRIEGFYDKFKLVPFGEFLPYEKTLEAIGLKEMVHIGDGFTPGKRTAPVSFPGVPRVLPLICYEGIFSSLDQTNYSGNNALLRPQWILNISNDAWFGPTTGPRQHLNLASYRAIEEGLPMVRSTPTGISVLIDPLGRVVSGTKISANERAYRDVNLTAVVAPPVFSSQRNLFTCVMACIVLLVVTIVTCVRVLRRNRRSA